MHEADPRWIVEERADAHNVNNWHWREMDATEWSKKKLKNLLNGLVIEDKNIAACTIEEITSCDGEASVSNRKKKIICFYEFELKGKWKGSLKDSDIKYSGLFEIPNLSEENDADEIDVVVTFGKDQRKCDELKEFMRTRGTPAIRAQLRKFCDALRTECATSIQLPTNDDNNKKKIAMNISSSKPDLEKDTNLQEKTANTEAKICTKKLTMSETFMTSADELYKTLTLKDRVSAWSRSPTSADAAVGEAFALFDGNVTGEYTALVLDEKISMRWRFKSWPAGHHSNVTLSLKQTSEGAEIHLEQSGVPESSTEATKSGWKNYYWRSIKMTFGYGASIL